MSIYGILLIIFGVLAVISFSITGVFGAEEGEDLKAVDYIFIPLAVLSVITVIVVLITSWLNPKENVVIYNTPQATYTINEHSEYLDYDDDLTIKSCKEDVCYEILIEMEGIYDLHFKSVSKFVDDELVDKVIVDDVYEQQGTLEEFVEELIEDGLDYDDLKDIFYDYTD